MTTPYLIVEDGGAELSALRLEYERRKIHAAQVMREKGMDSPEFREADAATGETWKRIREIQGDANKHWSA